MNTKSETLAMHTGPGVMGQRRFPGDLRLWVTPEALAPWVKTACSQFWVTDRDCVQPTPPDVRQRLRGLASVLTYAYITGRMDSAGIVFACRGEPVFEHFCATPIEDAFELMRFRRHHRSILVAAISEVLDSAWRARERYLNAQGGVGENEPAPDRFIEEALLRIHEAAEMDSYALDE